MNDVKSFWSTTDYSQRLSVVVTNGNGAFFAYRRLEMHLEAARVQMSRIEEAIPASSGQEPTDSSSQVEVREFMRERIVALNSVQREVHFYFVSWCGCRNMLEIIVGQPELLSAKKVFDSHRKTFEHYVAGRNSFEHYHDRLPGQRYEERVREIGPDGSGGARRAYSGFREGQFIHSDMAWDISRRSLEQLERTVHEVIEAVHQVIDLECARKGLSA